MSKTDLKTYLCDPLTSRMYAIGRIDGNGHMLDAVQQVLTLMASFAIALEGPEKAAERAYRLADSIVDSQAKVKK